MFAALRVLLVAVVGAVIGLGSAYLALTDERLDLTRKLGPWHVVTAPSPEDGEPYARARAARAGTIGLGAAEGVAFAARTDSGGALLDPDCHYVVEGSVPDGELWTLTVSDEAGRLPANRAGRIGFTSRDVIRRPDGSVAVVVGRTARPGNFLPIGELPSLVLTLRVYSSRLSAGLPNAGAMPRIRRTECSRGGADAR